MNFRFHAVLALILIFIGTAVAQQGTVIGPLPSATGRAITGQIPATATNDSGAAGTVGEYAAAGSYASNATVTITIAAPAVVTWTSHGIAVPSVTIKTATAVLFTTSGTLPTGLVASTVYYAVPIDANSFNVATSIANAIAGTFITTTGSQSGTQTGSFSISLTSNVTVDLNAIALTAGDWDIASTSYAIAGGTTTIISFRTTIGIAVATQNRLAGNFGSIIPGGAVLGGADFITVQAGPSRASLSGTTTYYTNVASEFGISTMATRGFMRVRRVR